MLHVDRIRDNLERAEKFGSWNIPNLPRNILVDVRKLLEASKSKSKYPVTMLYCNWCLHTEIAKSDRVVSEIFESVAKALVAGCAPGKTPAEKIDSLTNGVDEALAIGRLQDGLLDLCREYDLPTARFVQPFFDGFVVSILESIRDAPLALSPKALKSNVFTSLQTAANNDPTLTPARIWIELTNDVQAQFHEVEKGYIWNVTTYAPNYSSTFITISSIVCRPMLK